MAVVASLWVGGPLGVVQNICLSSFVYHNHTIYLYVYDMDMVVPDGVIKRNAEEIVSKSEIFTFHDQYAGFSDLFRYRMIKKTNLMWVDADTLCLGEYFFEDEKFVFIEETDEIIAGGILKIPSSHTLIDDLVAVSSKRALSKSSSKKESEWGALGPGLLTELVREYGLREHAQPAERVNAWNYHYETVSCWDPSETGRLLKKTDNSVCATFFTGGLRRDNFDANQPLPDGSTIKYYYDKYVAKFNNLI